MHCRPGRPVCHAVPPCTMAAAHLAAPPSRSLCPLLARRPTGRHFRRHRASAGCPDHPPPKGTTGPPPLSYPPCGTQGRIPPPSSPTSVTKQAARAPLHRFSLPRHLLPRLRTRDTPPFLPLLLVPTRAPEMPPPSLEIAQRHHRPHFIGLPPPPHTHTVLLPDWWPP
jgi:hypothetical protein